MDLRHEIIKASNPIPVYSFYSNVKQPNYTLPHFHSDLEIIYILSGTITVTQGIKTTQLEKGDMILFNSNEIHSTQCLNCYTTAYVMQVSYEFLNTLYKNQSPVYFLLPLLKNAKESEKNVLYKLQSLIHSFFEESNSAKEYKNFKLYSILCELLYELYENFIEDTYTPDSYLHKDYERISKIETYLKEHYAENITLKLIADHSGVTTAYFSRYFRKTFGITFSKYLSSLRLKYALHDIVTTNFSITDISEKNGFANYQQFSQDFKEMYGYTPRTYRKNFSQVGISSFIY